ncbi:dihydrofolate reductase family protein [Rhizohabitans arisaemae]|uniref:dihydrofolate reductase family protein n=1 Tax=Rhizohabitans arisaemae TaxID=2720610 RepID=UPI0024B0EC19|nr:dihydrofolate reductase family protein [Rhizohabitans arisaemae]
MGRVIYSMHVSLDGYIEDHEGGIGFSAPDEEVHRAANEEAKDAAAFLFGRRLHESMEEFWTTAARRDDLPEVAAEFAHAYVATPRVVFSDTLETVPEGVRLVRRADAVAEVTRLKQETGGDLSVGGADLAASLLDLIDEFRLYVMPVALGRGKPFFELQKHLKLRLIGHQVFASGTVCLRYEPADGAAPAPPDGA